MSDAGVVSGTPTTVGSSNVSLTVTDSAGSPATDDVTFTWNITPAPVAATIAEIQGTGATTPLVGQAVTTVLYPDFNLSIPSAPLVAGVDEDVRLELDFTAAPVSTETAAG